MQGEQINQYKIKVGGFSAELPKEIDRELRTMVTVEVDVYSVEQPSNEDGTVDRVYKSKLVGSTVVQQLGRKDVLICKSKRTKSQQLRAALWNINPEEAFYDAVMAKIIRNPEAVVEYLKDK